MQGFVRSSKFLFDEGILRQMRKTIPTSIKIFAFTVLFSLLIIRISHSSCAPFMEFYRPIYLSFDELRSAVRSQPAEPLKDPGKIMVKDQWIFVSERFKGVHVIDNSDPTSPRNIAFVQVPGNIDLAMKGDILYADSFIDLVAINVSHPEGAFVTGRLENIYPNEPLFQEDTIWSEPIDPNKGVVVGKELVGSTGGGPCNDHNSRSGCSGGSSGQEASVPPLTPADQSTGLNGSLARITIVKDHLYLLSGSNLKTVSIVELEHPVYVNAFGLGSNIETLYPYKEALFVGGQTGVQIIDISVPDNPTLTSRFQHPWQCDPIVVSGDKGYVTLRAGGPCGLGANQLDILDVSNVTAPVLLKSYSLNDPYGLAIDANTLFVADGSFGFQVFDVQDPMSLVQVGLFKERPARDIVLYSGRAHVIGTDGLDQYDYSALDKITLLSHIPTEK